MALATPTACVDRLLYPAECEDGELTPGEVCFEDDYEQVDVPFEPLALRVAPFDGDILSDVLVTGIDAAGAVIGSLSLARLDGPLAPLQPAAVSGCSAYPAVGDVGDGAVADLLFDDCDDTMLVFPGRVDGVFEPARLVDLDVATLTSALLDADGDGIGDVIALGITDDRIAISLARGLAMGVYDAPRLTMVGTRDASDAPYGFSIGWIDDDARFDLVLSHGDPNLPPTFVRGIPEGFGPPEPWPELGVARGVSFANTDGEGELEIVVFRDDPDVIEVWGGRLGTAKKIGETQLGAAAGLGFVGGDFDADRNFDLAFYDPEDDVVSMWLGDGRGRWRETASVRFPAAVKQLGVGDLDADGSFDLVAGTFAERTITIVRGAP